MPDKTNAATVSLERAFADLPRGWAATPTALPPGANIDASYDIVSPSADRERFIIEVKSRVYPADVPAIVHQLDAAAAMIPGAQRMIIAPYLGPGLRDALRERGISYADGTGTLFIATPHLYIERLGTRRARPEEGGKRPRRSSLRGPITARVVRCLCAAATPVGVRELAERARTDPGSVSRLLRYLEREGLVTRRQGAVVDVAWQDIVRLWAADLAKERAVVTCVATRGVERVPKLLEALQIRYAVTGARASSLLAPAAHTSTIDVYVDDPLAVQPSIGFEDAMGDVRLIRAFDTIVYSGQITVQGVRLANPVQIAADLISFPHRSDDEVTALFRWMETNEAVWREQ